jgi:hypothetical protein
VRCQYCGKNLWPLRGLFDEDFCSKDHRQRYNERVRKALDHLPKGQAAPRPKGIAGFQFEKPRTQEPAAAPRRSGPPRENPSSPAVPDFVYATGSPALAAGSFSTSVPPVTGESRATDISDTIAPNVMSIESLRERAHGSSLTAVGLADAPVMLTPMAGNMALKVSHRWNLSFEAFDELNHVYLHEPEPEMDAGLPAGRSAVVELRPVSATARAKHTAFVGPAGAGRIEFFPMTPHASAALPQGAEADTMRAGALGEGDNLWLEDLVSWRIPLSVAPMRSSLAMLPESDQTLALERFQNTQPASAAGAPAVAWNFETLDLERSPLQVAGPEVAPAMLIELPAPTSAAAQPLSPEGIMLDAGQFRLRLPELTTLAADPDLLTNDLADVTPAHSDVRGPQADGSGWQPIQADSVMPALSPELQGALADPKIGADLYANAGALELRNGARNVRTGLPINLPNRMVRLKHGPEFFAAEPVIADSVALPVAAKSMVAPSLTLPEMQTGDAHTLLRPAASQTLLPARGFNSEVALAHAARRIETATIEVPVIEAQAASFPEGRMKSMGLRLRDNGDRLPHYYSWMEPELALALPELRHEDDEPLALKVDVPEPRTVTVFETATFDQQSKVLSINDARSKRFNVPGYLKGMAAGLLLASFLWFGSSSIKSDGVTLRPGDLIRLTIQRRAVYEVGDDFHAGLVNWDGNGKNLVKSWNFDKEGFVRPGRLAIYKPSHDMSDYKLEFLTQVERKGVGWVFRAADDQNYYAMKLAVTEPGPRPLVALIRYQVIDGKKESRGETPLQVMMHNNQPYRVVVDVKGNQFLTSIEGQVVDSWSDDRLKTGGVGFFTEGSEKARLYWMKISKNTDFLGKLCAMLVPKES